MISDKMRKALEKCGVDVSNTDFGIQITYYTKHGGEEDVDVPESQCDDEAIAEWLSREYENYDVSYETYIWLDNTGHGANGAPHELEDVLADKKEWERKLYELSLKAGRLAKQSR